MKTYEHFSAYLAHFFIELEIFRTQLVEDIKTHIMCSVTFFSKIVPFWGNVGKPCTARQAKFDNMAHAHWMLDN